MGDVLVLCYHAVSESWRAPLSVTPDRLERQLRHLVGRGYRGATFRDAVHAPRTRRTLAVTFDDAYRSVRDLAEPILSALGLPGTVFAPTAFIGSDQPMAWPGIDRWRGDPHEVELTPMSWDELGALAERGWEIGSHTRTHPRLTELDNRSLAEQLSGSRVDCEEGLGIECTTISYPYGDVDARVVGAARAAGYVAAGALPARLHPPFALRWPRIGIYHVDRPLRFRAKVSPVLRGLRARSGARSGYPPGRRRLRQS
jgi:peptidoglycan/xylan/chitin deacetylase (PgdA/CDA1 family)